MVRSSPHEPWISVEYWMDGWTNGQMDELTGGRAGGWMDGLMNGLMDYWMDV